MSYRMELSFNNRAEVIELPVLPPSIEISDGIKSSTYDVVGLGEINVIKERKLSEYSFSSFFPGQQYPFLTSFDPKKPDHTRPFPELLPPIEYVLLITRWMETGRPIRFIIGGAGSGVKLNTAASIESFQWRESAGGTGDIEYTLKLKHYRFHAAKKFVVKDNKSMPAGTKRADERVQPKTYTMVAGDSLWKVARKQLGNGSRWTEIQRLNGIADAEIRRLPIGKVLKLP